MKPLFRSAVYFIVAIIGPRFVEASITPVVFVFGEVDPSDVVRTVDDRHFGLNATIWDGEFSSTTTRDLLAAAGTRALRFPGGSLSDEYHWATNTTLDNTWEWATCFDDFASVAAPARRRRRRRGWNTRT